MSDVRRSCGSDDWVTARHVWCVVCAIEVCFRRSRDRAVIAWIGRESGKPVANCVDRRHGGTGP